MALRKCIFVTLFYLVIHLSLIDAANPDTQYSPIEKAALKQFKDAVAGIIYEDFHKLDSYLIHFLRHKKLNVDDATLLLKENFKWRKSEKVDFILQEKRMIELEKQLSIYTDAVDMEGRPILGSIIGQIDIRKFVVTGKTDEFLRYNIYVLEKIMKQIYKQALAGKDVSQYIELSDLNGFNLRQHACLPCIPQLTVLARLILDRYPNAVHQIIYINAPRAFATVFSIVKDILPPDLIKSINVFGFDKSEWQPYLSKLIEDDQLAIALGGAKSS